MLQKKIPTIFLKIWLKADIMQIFDIWLKIILWHQNVTKFKFNKKHKC